jgi:hypothetical protein
MVTGCALSMSSRAPTGITRLQVIRQTFSATGLNLRIQDFFQLGQILMLPNGNQCIGSLNFGLGQGIKKHTAVSSFYRKDYQVVVLPYPRIFQSRLDKI